MSKAVKAFLKLFHAGRLGKKASDELVEKRRDFLALKVVGGTRQTRAPNVRMARMFREERMADIQFD